jgi:hypothetical protein
MTFKHDWLSPGRCLTGRPDPVCVGCKSNFAQLAVISGETVIGATCLKVWLRSAALFGPQVHEVKAAPCLTTAHASPASPFDFTAIAVDLDKCGERIRHRRSQLKAIGLCMTRIEMRLSELAHRVSHVQERLDRVGRVIDYRLGS